MKVTGRKATRALAVVARWIECQPANGKVAGLIPSQGTCLGCKPGPQLGACERQWIVRGDRLSLSHIDVSLPLFLPPFP